MSADSCLCFRQCKLGFIPIVSLCFIGWRYWWCQKCSRDPKNVPLYILACWVYCIGNAQ